MARHDRGDRLDRYPITADVTPSRATYLAVARARQCDPLDLPPLAETIDPDCLDSLFDESRETADNAASFEYAGCSVTVMDDAVDVDHSVASSS